MDLKLITRQEKQYIVVSDMRDILNKGVVTTTYTKEEFEEKFGSIRAATQYYCSYNDRMISGEEYDSFDDEAQKACSIKVRCEEVTRRVLDSHGHLVVKQDLYNHENITSDGIAEAFAEFAKKEGLCFFQ